MSVLGEMKRRKVFQVAAVYAVAAWLVIQIIDVVGEPLSLPDWFDTVVIVLFAVGFPIAVILAWAFDVTPQGIRAAADVEVSGSPVQPAAQTLNYIMHGLVLIAVSVLIFDQYVLSPRGDTPSRISFAATDDALRVSRLEIGLGDAERIGDTTLDVHVAISKDGQDIVYAVQRDGHSQLYHRAINELEATPIAGTVGGWHPTFSPDGDSVVFFGAEAENLLKKVAIDSGAVQSLGDALYANGASWGADDTIFVATQDNAGGRTIFSVPATGSGQQEVILLADNDKGFVEPHVLPGGDVLVIGVRPGTGGIGAARDGQIAVLSLETGEYRELIEGGLRPRYAPTGHLVFARRGGLWAVPFDLEQLEATGPEVLIVPAVQQDGAFGKAAYDFSETGTLVYMPGIDTTALNIERRLVWVDRNRVEEPLDLPPNAYYYPRVSRNGRLAVSIYDGAGLDIWIQDLNRGALNRLTFGGADRFIWTTDGSQVVYNRYGTSADGGMYSQIFDGSEQPERLTSTTYLQRPSFFSPHGPELIYDQLVDQWDIYALSIDGERSSQPLIASEFNELLSTLSPDGRYILYTASTSGIDEVYVRSYPSLAGQRQISSGGGYEAIWGPNGDEIFYRRGNEMWVASVDTESGIAVLESRVLFEGEYFDDANNRPTYDLSPDGERFLMLKPEVDRRAALQSEQIPLIVVQNWFEELSRLAPPAEPSQ